MGMDETVYIWIDGNRYSGMEQNKMEQYEMESNKIKISFYCLDN